MKRLSSQVRFTVTAKLFMLWFAFHVKLYTIENEINFLLFVYLKTLMVKTLINIVINIESKITSKVEIKF